MRRFARAAIEVVRLACARERLEVEPEALPRAAAGREAHRTLRMILAVEPLPLDEPAPPAPRGRGWLRWLFAPEPLPHDPSPEAPAATEAARHRWLRWLFAPEPLPLDPEPPRARRPGWLAALFAPERLDDSP